MIDHETLVKQLQAVQQQQEMHRRQAEMHQAAFQQAVGAANAIQQLIQTLDREAAQQEKA